MSFKSLLLSDATIWNVTQSTAFGISESTSFSAQVDCRINAKKSKGEGLIDAEEANIGSHIIYLEPGVVIDTTKQLISNGVIYHIKNVREIYGRKSKHHYEADADEIE